MNTSQKMSIATLVFQASIALCLGLFLFMSFTPAASAAACTTKPQRPKAQFPENGATVSTIHVPLSWTGANCRTRYSVVVRQGATFGRPSDGAYNFKRPAYTTRRLEKGHWYWWVVEACNEVGCTSSRWSKFYLGK
jgi:hypothetical protein